MNACNKGEKSKYLSLTFTDQLNMEIAKLKLINKELDDQLDGLQHKFNIQVDNYNKLLEQIKEIQASHDLDLNKESVKLELGLKDAQIVN
jgi:hypothetical protein